MSYLKVFFFYLLHTGGHEVFLGAFDIFGGFCVEGYFKKILYERKESGLRWVGI